MIWIRLTFSILAMSRMLVSPFAGWFGTAAALTFGATALGAGTVLLGWLLWPLPPSSVNAEVPREAEAVGPPL